MQPIVVIGPESTGSTLIARVLSAIIKKPINFGATGPNSNLIHRSLPYDTTKKWVDVDKDFPENSRYVVCIRDQGCVLRSKIKRPYINNTQEARQHSNQAKPIIAHIIKNKPCFIWSYEVFMWLGYVYLDLLLDFLEIKRTNVELPKLRDGNNKYFK